MFLIVGSSPTNLFYLMAQKINSISSRLSKRLNWKHSTCLHNINDYTNQVVNTSNVLAITSNILQKTLVGSCSTLVNKSSKGYTFSYNVFDQRLFIYFIKLLSISNQNKQNFYSYRFAHFNQLKLNLRRFLFNNKQVIQKISNVNSQKMSIGLNWYKKLSLILYPSIITEFVKFHIAGVTPIILKKNKFASGLN